MSGRPRPHVNKRYIDASKEGFEKGAKQYNDLFDKDVPEEVKEILDSLAILKNDMIALSTCLSSNVNSSSILPKKGGGPAFFDFEQFGTECDVNFAQLEQKSSVYLAKTKLFSVVCVFTDLKLSKIAICNDE